MTPASRRIPISYRLAPDYRHSFEFHTDQGKVCITTKPPKSIVISETIGQQDSISPQTDSVILDWIQEVMERIRQDNT